MCLQIWNHSELSSAITLLELHIHLIVKTKAKREGNVEQAHTSRAFEVGILSTIKGAMLFRDFNVEKLVITQSFFGIVLLSENFL